jgi:hypothetical protein
MGDKCKLTPQHRITIFRTNDNEKETLPRTRSRAVGNIPRSQETVAGVKSGAGSSLVCWCHRRGPARHRPPTPDTMFIRLGQPRAECPLRAILATIATCTDLINSEHVQRMHTAHGLRVGAGSHGLVDDETESELHRIPSASKAAAIVRGLSIPMVLRWCHVGVLAKILLGS